jgi:phosphoserine aminotransferase
MAEDRVYNFSAGPSMLPIEVLEQAREEILNFGGSGMSVMEMSHRSKAFISIFEETKANFRRLLNIPETH